VNLADKLMRWSEARILKVVDGKPPSKMSNKKQQKQPIKRVFIHYMGWNSCYATWDSFEQVAAHGSQTKVKITSSSSWDRKIDLF
jgi:hypothetical protein